MRQLTFDELDLPLEPIGVTSERMRQPLEERGFTFSEAHDDDGPGPRQWTLVGLDDGSQYFVEHHYAHPDNRFRFVVIGGQVGSATPAELCHRFAGALGVPRDEFSWVADDWPRPQS
jgi:hypothetical protein